MDGNLDWTELRRVIDRAEAGGGAVGVTAIPPRGAAFTHRGARRFRAASTVKIPIMIELYRQVDRGERALADLYWLRSEDRAPGSGVLLHLHDGAELTLEDLIYLMISVSDNTATNMLIDVAGMENVGVTMRSLGMADSTLGRKMKGRPAQGDEQENWATPDDYAAVIGALLEGRAASAGACERMLAMLEKQQCTRRLSRYLPEDESIRWGSKTGSIAGVTNDVGFVASDRGTVIVSVFCEDLADQHVGEQVIGDVARAVLRDTGIVEPTSTS
jgi:beta-lactamase class A